MLGGTSSGVTVTGKYSGLFLNASESPCGDSATSHACACARHWRPAHVFESEHPVHLLLTCPHGQASTGSPPPGPALPLALSPGQIAPLLLGQGLLSGESAPLAPFPLCPSSDPCCSPGCPPGVLSPWHLRVPAARSSPMGPLQPGPPL